MFQRFADFLAHITPQDDHQSRKSGAPVTVLDTYLHGSVLLLLIHPAGAQEQALELIWSSRSSEPWNLKGGEKGGIMSQQCAEIVVDQQL